MELTRNRPCREFKLDSTLLSSDYWLFSYFFFSWFGKKTNISLTIQLHQPELVQAHLIVPGLFAPVVLAT